MQFPNLSVTLKQLKKDAVRLQKSGLRRMQALDEAARAAGFSGGWVHAKRALAIAPATRRMTRVTWSFHDPVYGVFTRQILLEGEASADDVALVHSKLNGDQFIPSQVGLPDLQPMADKAPGRAAHCWHELDRATGIEVADVPFHARARMTVANFIAHFRNVVWIEFSLDDLFDRPPAPNHEFDEGDRRQLISKVVEYRVWDVLDDVDCSLSTLRFRLDELERMEKLLSSGDRVVADALTAHVLSRHSHYCSGQPRYDDCDEDRPDFHTREGDTNVVTLFRYSYENGARQNRQIGEVLLSGKFSPEDLDVIRSRLDRLDTDGAPEWPGQFIPSQVGLPDLQNDGDPSFTRLPDEEHPWHRIESVETLTIGLGFHTACSARELAERFQAAEWQEYLMEDVMPDSHDRDGLVATRSSDEQKRAEVRQEYIQMALALELDDVSSEFLHYERQLADYEAVMSAVDRRLAEAALQHLLSIQTHYASGIPIKRGQPIGSNVLHAQTEAEGAAWGDDLPF